MLACPAGELWHTPLPLLIWTLKKFFIAHSQYNMRYNSVGCSLNRGYLLKSTSQSGIQYWGQFVVNAHWSQSWVSIGHFYDYCILLTGNPIPIVVAGELYGAVHHGQGHVEARPVLLGEAEGRHREKVNQTLPGCRHIVSGMKIEYCLINRKYIFKVIRLRIRLTTALIF